MTGAAATTAVWVSCPACGEDRPTPRFRKNGFAVVRCRACGLGYVNPRPQPAQLAAWYDKEHFVQAGASGAPHLRHGAIKQATAKLRLALLQTVVAKGRLADVGCGGGFFAAAAAAGGWAAVGLEPSEEAAGLARRQGVAVVRGCLEALPFADSHFDAITMFDVVEHVFSPAACLAEARRLLVPGGRLLIEAPNMAGWLPRLLGARHPSVRPPEHLTYFTPHSLRRLLERNGYQVERLLVRAPKVLTLDYVLELSRPTNPWMTAVASGTLGRWPALRRRPVALPMDSLVALATVCAKDPA